jgi:hypothetical protein
MSDAPRTSYIGVGETGRRVTDECPLGSWSRSPPSGVACSHGATLGRTIRLAARSGGANLLRMKIRDVLRLLLDDGWVLVRTRGSHQQYKHPTKQGFGHGGRPSR